MYPFPPDEQLRIFAGDAIAQISLDPHGVQLNFDGGRHVVAYHRIEHFEPNGTIWGYDCEAAEGPPLLLHRLLCRRVITVEREEFRFTLRFEDGSALAVLSELGPFECGHIQAPEIGIVIF